MKMQGWKQRFLSQASREVLIKAGLTVVPAFAMNCSEFPKKICMELDSLIARFSRASRRKMARYTG